MLKLIFMRMHMRIYVHKSLHARDIETYTYITWPFAPLYWSVGEAATGVGVPICTCVYAYVHVRTYVCMYACMHVRIFIYIYIYIYIYTYACVLWLER